MADPRSNNSDDEVDDTVLYGEFEAACTSVSNLFRQHSWRHFQSAAAHTTQLYRTGLETSKRALDKGVQQGRLQLAKELVALKRYAGKIDAQDLYQVLHKYALLPSDHPMSPRQRRVFHHPDGNITQAVNLFQQALNPPNSSPTSNHRPADLNNFLQHQILRHRKRAHSPMDQQNANNVPHSKRKKP